MLNDGIHSFLDKIGKVVNSSLFHLFSFLISVNKIQIVVIVKEVMLDEPFDVIQVSDK